MEKTHNGWTKEQILLLLASSDAAVKAAVLSLYHRQTADEQAQGDTKHHNKVGFTAFDAEFLTRFAEAVRKNKPINPGFMAAARKAVRKYHRQLIEIANAKRPEGPKHPKLKGAA